MFSKKPYNAFPESTQNITKKATQNIHITYEHLHGKLYPGRFMAERRGRGSGFFAEQALWIAIANKRDISKKHTQVNT